MTASRSTIWVERALVLLIVASLGGTLNLVITAYRRASTSRLAGSPDLTSPIPELPVAVAAVTPPPLAIPETVRPAKRAMKSVSIPPIAAEDPTKKAVAELEAAAARELAESRKADTRTRSLEAARQAATVESERWRRRELLVKEQIARLGEQAGLFDREADKLAAERDVLVKERDALKTAVIKSRQGQGSYAVLPYKGPNGTWRRPIVLDCSNGTVTLRPKGPTFSMLDLSGLINPRSSPVIVAIARELLRVEMTESPDGSQVVPYFVFLVRPDGIRPYYEARARLEPLGIAFGYELIEQDLKVDVPDFDDVRTWDGTIPLEEPIAFANDSNLGKPGLNDDVKSGQTGSRRREDAPLDFGRGSDRSIGVQRGGPVGVKAGDGDTPEDFIWPSQRSSRPGDVADLEPGNEVDGGGRSIQGLLGGGGPSTGRTHDQAKPGARVAKNSREQRDDPGGGQKKGPGYLAWPGQSSDGTSGVSSDRRRGTSREGSGRGIEGSSNRAHAAGPGNADLSAGAGRLPVLEPANGGGQGGHSDDVVAGPVKGPEPRIEDPSRSGRTSRDNEKVPHSDPGRAERSSNGLSSRGFRGGRGVNTDGLEGSDRTETAGDRIPSALLPAPDTLGNNSRMAGSTGTSRGLVFQPGRGSHFPGDGSSPGSTSTRSSQLSENPGNAPSGPTRSASSRSGGAPSLGTLGLSLGSTPGAMTGSPGSAGGTGLTIGGGSESSSSTPRGGAEAFGELGPSGRMKDGETKVIEVPFEILVVCDSDGVVVQPGAHRITGSMLRSRSRDDLVVRQLVAVARQRAEADPAIRPMPRLKFLVERDGASNFWEARKQVLFTGLGWPMSLQVTGGQDIHLLDKEIW